MNNIYGSLGDQAVRGNSYENKPSAPIAVTPPLNSLFESLGRALQQVSLAMEGLESKLGFVLRAPVPENSATKPSYPLAESAIESQLTALIVKAEEIERHVENLKDRLPL